MPLTVDQKRALAKSRFEENEKGYKRYVGLVTAGNTEDYARDLVKEAFKWTDRRLDKVLETRAGAFSPKTASELEAKALVYIQRLDNSIGALCRHCDRQLDRLDDMDDVDENGEPNWVSVELIEESQALKLAGGKADGSKQIKTRKKKMTVADAIRVLGEAKLGYNQRLLDGLKSLKVDTIININKGTDISDYSVEELKVMKERQEKSREGRVVDAEYTVAE